MKKVGIIGAGVSGLACAIELEKHGIKPVIFEEKHMVGSPMSFARMSLNFLFRPVRDQINYLKSKYNLNIKPISNINSLRVQGPSNKYRVTGQLGYSFLRGEENYSLEKQLANMLSTEIKYESPATYEDLVKEFDILVIATGTGNSAKRLGIWQSTLKNWTRGSTILGKFNPQQVVMWLNTKFAERGFALLVPISTERASLFLTVPNSSHNQLGNYWKIFMESQAIQPEIVELWDVEYETGLVHPHQVENTYLIGNSGGFVGSFLGTGVFPSIISGLEAARSIVHGSNYEEEIRFMSDITLWQAKARQLWNRLDNHQLDKAVALTGSFPFKQTIFKTNINVLKSGDKLARLLN